LYFLPLPQGQGSLRPTFIVYRFLLDKKNITLIRSNTLASRKVSDCQRHREPYPLPRIPRLPERRDPRIEFFTPIETLRRRFTPSQTHA
jgi:hypothetical protein